MLPLLLPVLLLLLWTQQQQEPWCQAVRLMASLYSLLL
jgi:hypothetical protein